MAKKPIEREGERNGGGAAADESATNTPDHDGVAECYLSLLATLGLVAVISS